MAMLDVNRRQMNIYSFEWQWEVEQPIKPKKVLGNVHEEEESNLFSDDQSELQDDNVLSESSFRQQKSGRSSSREKNKKQRKRSTSSKQLQTLLERQNTRQREVGLSKMTNASVNNSMD